MADTAMIALVPKGQAIPAIGDQVHLSWDADDLHLMEPGA
jgi:putative spermidine/putrescine transport system ATP-binding protein